MTSNTSIDRESLKNDLDRVIAFINNCDQKTSIILTSSLAVVALILGLCGDDYYKYFNALYQDSDWINPYTFLFFATVLILITGFGFLVSALRARTNLDLNKYPKSAIYYGTIAQLNYDDYRKTIQNRTNEEYIEDIVSQIHIDSCICTKKYAHYNRGLLFSVLGWALLFVTTIIIIFD